MVDETVWLQKISNILKTNRRIGIGDNNLNAQDEAHIKRLLLFFNDQRDDIELAYEPIQSLSEEEIEQILKENYDLIGHPGIQKTYDRIRERHRVPDLMKRIQQHVESCDTCQTSKTTRIRPREEPCITDTPLEPNDKIAMDLLGPLKKTKKCNQYIPSIHDELTKYLILVPLKTQQTETIWNALLNHYIYVFSAPKKILIDRGQNFISSLM